MTIYLPRPSKDFELCHPKDDAHFHLIAELINGNCRMKDWKPINVELIKHDEGVYLKKSDSPWLGSHALIFKECVVESMRLFLENFGEFLPLENDECTLYLFNPFCMIDVLDQEKSKIQRFKDGRVMIILQYCFLKDKIQDTHVFKIPNLRTSPTFVSDNFVKLWTEYNFRGIEFEKIWQS